MICPLCLSHNCQQVGSDKRRCFFRCDTCTLIFVPHAYHLTSQQERRRYDLHDNTESNEGYVRFLTQVADIVEDESSSHARILDFGCGREAVLSKILRHRGKRCDCYDPLYHHSITDTSVRYDVIVLCEVIEHCRDVQCTLHEIKRLLTDNATVLIRTQCYPPVDRLTTWWYAQDMTHVNFFSQQALETAAHILDKKLYVTSYRDVFLIR